MFFIDTNWLMKFDQIWVLQDCKIFVFFFLIFCLYMECIYFIDFYNFMLMKHFSNAGFPCPIMQSPSDHFLRAINTDFDRIIAMCKNWQVSVSGE